ncbi:MAG: hypothetical protein FWF65_09590 [Bacteroidetes bacterium]|nr:hypothetical protein [Bacteroidota bacterium]
MKIKCIHFTILFLLSIISVWAQNTNGTDFWVTFGKNPMGSKSGEYPDIRIRIVSDDQPIMGTITFTNSNTTRLINMPAYSVANFDLTTVEVLDVCNMEEGKNNKSIHMRATPLR